MGNLNHFSKQHILGITRQYLKFSVESSFIEKAEDSKISFEFYHFQINLHCIFSHYFSKVSKYIC